MPRGDAGRPSRFAFSTRDVGFRVDGDRCVGTLYTPDRPADPPVLVWGASPPLSRRTGLDAVAELLAERGYAVALFDPRGVGDSDGAPRNLLDSNRLAADWAAALDRVRTLEDVDGARPVVGGHGLAGGAAVAAAADDRRVRGVVGVAPVLDGRWLLRARPRRAQARALGRGVADRLGSLVGRSQSVPVVGDADEDALVPAPGAAASVRALLPAGETIPTTPARSLLAARGFQPGERLDDLRCPVCLVAGGEDAVVDAAAVSTAAATVREGTFVRLPVGHVDVVRGRSRRAVVDHAHAFLREILDV